MINAVGVTGVAWRNEWRWRVTRAVTDRRRWVVKAGTPRGKFYIGIAIDARGGRKALRLAHRRLRDALTYRDAVQERYRAMLMLESAAEAGDERS